MSHRRRDPAIPAPPSDLCAGDSYRRRSAPADEESRRPLLDSAAAAAAAEAVRSVIDELDRAPRRFSGGGGGGSSSYGGSLFTIEGSGASGTTVTALGSGSGREEEGEVERSWAQRARESYYLQLSLAMRLTSQAFLAESPHCLLQESAEEICGVSSDSDTVSYRLWVSGCLSFSDKITHGFYNILGIDPYLWAMCNGSEEGRRLPTLTALREANPSESSLEVVLIDKNQDYALIKLERRAQELCHALGFTLDLVKELARLVSDCMGGAMKSEEGDLYMLWKSSSKQLRKRQQCIVVPIGSLYVGFCRHRAILFKELADLIGLPCRIAQGCKYCSSAHRSSCLVKLEDAKNILREYVVDLIGEPGNVNDPDSSINGRLLSFVPSPFQVSHLMGCKDYYTPNTCCSQQLIREHKGVLDANSKHS
ncbi:Serine/threonine-protein kinase CTR1, partial [Ananas comosus]